MKKTLSLLFGLLAAALVVGCAGQKDDDDPNNGTTLEGDISLIASRNIIRADGSDAATLTVLLTDQSGMIHDVTATAELYVGDSAEPMATTQFASSEAGTYTLYALYGMAISDEIEVKAVDGVADLPADSDSAASSFVHHILLVQHTGVACPNCPDLMNNLKRIAEDDAYAGRYYHIASHSYGQSLEDDPAYSSSASILSGELGVRSYPWLTFNILKADKYLGEVESIKNCIDLFHEESARVGLSAATSTSGGNIYAHIGIKAAESGNYRIGVWVLEDNIHGTQSGATASWQHIHNNCLREMAGSNKNERLYGRSVGQVESGATARTIVEIPISDKWATKNCKLLIFATTDNGNGNLELVNSTLCPLGESVTYAYNK